MTDFEWKNDCGGDKVLDDGEFVKFYAVAWPDGTSVAKLFVGGKVVVMFGSYKEPVGSQVQAMAACEVWVRERAAEVRKVLEAGWWPAVYRLRN